MKNTEKGEKELDRYKYKHLCPQINPKTPAEKQKLTHGIVVAVIYLNLTPKRINDSESLTTKLRKKVTLRIPIPNHNL